jgi:hypothetical protein
VAQPPVTDDHAIIDAVRRHGSVHYPTVAVPGEFTAWRRRLRQVARTADVTCSVDYVLVEGRDYQISEEDTDTTTDVIEAHLLGQQLTFEQALRARRRQRMRLAPTLECGRDDVDG